MRPLAVLILILLGACAPTPPPQPRNVVLILVDTLRADHLGVYGYGRPTSPNLDAFARGAVLFEDARSQASCTFPSANSLLTSRYPAAFMGQAEQAMGIPAAIPSVAEILQGKGYRTVAVSASPIVRKSPTRFNPQGGFGRGFETFSEDCLWKPAECVNRVAMEELAKEDGRPFFLYLHYMDPHGPYAPPPDHVRRFATGSPDKAFIREGNPNPIGDMLYKGAPDPGATPADLQHLIDLYDDEIAYFDGQLALLLQRLRESGRMEDTLVVLTSDHGEEFLEHGHIKHCRTLFDTSIRIPLILHAPGAAPKTVTRPAENVDVVPTLLDFLGIGTEGLRLEGRSLRPLLSDRLAEEETEESPDHQFSAQGPLRSVADGGFKLVEDLAGGSVALYDLRADPGETKDVLRDRRRDFHRLRRELTAWLAATEGQHAAGESVRKAEEAEKKLRALGYIE